MLGLSYLGATSVAGGMGRKNLIKVVREGFSLQSPSLGMRIAEQLSEFFNLSEQQISYIGTTITYILEGLGIKETPKLLSIGIIIKNTLGALERTKTQAHMKIIELFNVSQHSVTQIRQIIVKEYFQLLNKFDLIIDGVKKLWERCFTKRGEY